MTSIPRSEYPRPQFVRADWLNLNGVWTFTFDTGKSGAERGLAKSTGFDREILVPFCPESRLSGVAHTDFIEMMWYHRAIEAPADWRGRRILLHFGAVDYECEAFIDGSSVGRHRGGGSSFAFDITAAVSPGSRHNLVLCVRDETRSGLQPCGKQSARYASHGCHYTRTTGIWQTVWMEAVATFGLADCRIVSDVDSGKVILEPTFFSAGADNTFTAQLLDAGKVVASVRGRQSDGIPLVLDVRSPKLWSPSSPFLYDLVLEVSDAQGAVVDSVKSCVGMRKVHIEGNRVFLNNEPLYLRLVLDQGFYPEGIWTAPSDEALKRDIELSMRAGFNGARLHQKVFEPRFHYWADRLGYLTWGEFASWGIDIWGRDGNTNNRDAAWNFISEWREVVVRDRNHPSIIAWTPLNETSCGAGGLAHERFHADIYDLTRALDPTHPVNETSGYAHVKTDLWTVHNYEQDPDRLRAQLTPAQSGVWRNIPEHETGYSGQPYIVDEFGGIKWVPEGKRPWAADSWGYGDGPKSLDEFYSRLEGLVEVLLGMKHVAGYCYTQLTDVEQEQNGIYTYDRGDKFDMSRVKAIFSREPG